jgi:ketosteroid isomerase-like protein
MTLSRDEILTAMIEWNRAWDRHDLDGVMDLFHEEVLFENWTGGKAVGKEALRKAWAPWFADHGHFRFKEEDLFADEQEQKVLYAWELSWPSREKGFEGKPERRRGVDIIHFKDGKIIKKLTYSKTNVVIEGKRRALTV